jgi:hypothetical protein
VQIEENRGHEVSCLMLRYDLNVLINSIFMQLQKGLLFYHQQLHHPSSIEGLALDCKVKYTDTNYGIMPEAHNVRVQFMQSEENDLVNTLQ